VTEQQIQQHIRIACGTGSTRLFRNNTGTLKDANGRPVQFGLCKAGDGRHTSGGVYLYRGQDRNRQAAP